MNLLTNATWSTNCWLSKVKGLTATPIGTSNYLAGENVYGGQTTLSMVSPRHYLSATHVQVFQRGQLMAFLDTNNVVHWRRAIDQMTLGTDIDVGILDSDLPASVGFLPVMSPSFTNYLPRSAAAKVQGIGMNQDLFVFGQPMTFQGSIVLNWDPLSAVPYGLGTNWNVVIRSGDSSLPERFLIQGQLILVTQHWEATSGPHLALRFGDINQAMHTLSINHNLGTDYQLTPYVFTNWPAGSVRQGSAKAGPVEREH
jgi:hypothetical protein